MLLNPGKCIFTALARKHSPIVPPNQEIHKFWICLLSTVQCPQTWRLKHGIRPGCIIGSGIIPNDKCRANFPSVQWYVQRGLFYVIATLSFVDLLLLTHCVFEWCPCCCGAPWLETKDINQLQQIMRLTGTPPVSLISRMPSHEVRPQTRRTATLHARTWPSYNCHSTIDSEFFIGSQDLQREITVRIKQFRKSYMEWIYEMWVIRETPSWKWRGEGCITFSSPQFFLWSALFMKRRLIWFYCIVLPLVSENISCTFETEGFNNFRTLRQMRNVIQGIAFLPFWIQVQPVAALCSSFYGLS